MLQRVAICWGYLSGRKKFMLCEDERGEEMIITLPLPLSLDDQFKGLWCVCGYLGGRRSVVQMQIVVVVVRLGLTAWRVKSWVRSRDVVLWTMIKVCEAKWRKQWAAFSISITEHRQGSRRQGSDQPCVSCVSGVSTTPLVYNNIREENIRPKLLQRISPRNNP